ncbi:uncharacterized protein LOC124700392 [Lolium rigidum]|uniref:uncharacterized protein LOC124700392 n=1 Tax=Lolium rigidum TaxID=89674 RepID=UPI001F5D320B|nr:uncharacterized protein LOC124700392 [Lolium rigidum]
MPTKTPAKGKEPLVQDALLTSGGSNSFTPIPEPHKKRIVKPAQNQKSPFLGCSKKETASKFANEVYERLCSYGGETKDDINKSKIIDDGKYFIYVRDLADSVRPGAWLSNSTCEMAIRVLAPELAKQKKHVMPLILATKLRKATCINDRVVTKAFKMNSENRLDHKEQVMFPVLQDLTPDIKQHTGHYYLIVLNLKAERFEVMDSLRAKGNRVLVKDYRLIIGSIKYLWAKNYSESTINIENWVTEHIDTPRQKTTCNCGFFMLKAIELWNGRKMTAAINPSDMPDIRKQSTLKWLECVDNKIEWQELLF